MQLEDKPQPPFSEEFRKSAVDLAFSSGRPSTEVARELGINPSTLGTWIRKERRFRLGNTQANAKPGDLVEDNKRLEKRVRELEQEREILKRFTAFWVKESSR